MKPVKTYDDPIKNAYFAGLIDGEGNIGSYARKGTYTLRSEIKVNMTCYTTMKALQDYFGGALFPRKVPEGNKPQWRWFVSGSTAVRVCRALLPYLITKKARAEIVIALRNKP